MKILLVSSKYQPEYSGSGLRAHNTYKRLKIRFGIDYDVLASSLENAGAKKYQYDGVDVLTISGILKGANFKGVWGKIAAWVNLPFEVFRVWRFIKIRINDYDLLHTFGDCWSIGFLTWYFAKHNKATMRELCNDIPDTFYPKRFRKWIKPIFQKDNTMIVAISPMLKKLAKKNGAKHVWHRPNPIDEAKFNLIAVKHKYRLRKILSKFDKDDIVLSCVASFIDRKNQLFLLKVLNLLDKKYKLVFAGPVIKNRIEYYQQVLSYIKKLKLENRVQINAQFITNPEEYMTLADIYCFPSKAEGLGTPILESQACGLPIIANELNGITDQWITSSGVSCVLDEQLWAKRIKQISNIPQEVLTKNANYLLSVASSEVIDRQYVRHFNKLINATTKLN